MTSEILILLSPILFIIVAVASWFQSGLRPNFLKKLSILSTLVSIVIAAICSIFVFQNGLIETAFIGIRELGFSLRMDAVSMIMFSMIGILSFIVMKFSMNYMDGDHRQGKFIGRLAATIASVQFLVLAGNLGVLLLAWIFTSISLHRLLIFYYDRPGALIAAKKKFIVARLGDAALLLSVILLYDYFGTGNLEVIFQQIKSTLAANALPGAVEAAALLLALAAIFKSAQFPTHGWLVEVMETPTPVSALLHAGLLNAGPFLIVRMAFLMEASTYAPLLLIILGGFTAFFASIVFLTQTSIKTALAYSSIAHMGFSLMVCGMGVFPAAMLHLVAHSFYKAHAFLSTGSVIDVIRSSKYVGLKRTGSALNIVLGVVMALMIYSGFALLWGINPAEQFSLLAIGAVIVMGLSRLFTSAIDSNGSFRLMIRATFMAIVVAAAFFSLESGMHYVLENQIPALSVPNILTIVLVCTMLTLFAIATTAQIIAPALKDSQSYKALAIHFRNGLYVNAMFDRMIGSLHIHAPESAPELDPAKNHESVEHDELIKATIYKQPAV